MIDLSEDEKRNNVDFMTPREIRLQYYG